MHIYVGKERKENLLKLKRALEKVSGKPISYGDAIDFLFDVFLSCECEKKKEETKEKTEETEKEGSKKEGSKKVDKNCYLERKLKERVDYLKSLFPFLFEDYSPEKYRLEDLVEVVPPYLKRKIVKVAKEKKISSYLCFQKALEIGLEVQNTFPIFLSKLLTKTLLKVYTFVKQTKGEKEANLLLKRITMKAGKAVATELQKYEKKLKKF